MLPSTAYDLYTPQGNQRIRDAARKIYGTCAERNPLTAYLQLRREGVVWDPVIEVDFKSQSLPSLEPLRTRILAVMRALGNISEDRVTYFKAVRDMETWVKAYMKKTNWCAVTPESTSQ